MKGFVVEEAQRDVEERLKALPTTEGFRDHLTRISEKPHPFGSEANVQVGTYLAEVMAQAGLDVDTYVYDVYTPQNEVAPYVALVTPIRKPLNIQEYILKEDRFSGHPDLTPGWVAFSGSGDVTAEVVYVNYGQKEDFDRLRALGVSVRGKVVLARYGMNFRGYKVKFAEAAGAVGVIMYSDPADTGYVKGVEYPEGRFGGESAVQRGSLLTLPYAGDPLTPGVAALPDAKRLDPAEVAFPKIPVVPMPYASAIEILKRMTGSPVPVGWQGGLPFAYRITGGTELKVRLKVTQRCHLKRATNVVGTLWGESDPDAWVMLGCHYDAWAFGTSDPNSGTAMLLGLSEALGVLKREGVRPKRTIRIAHWDAEEFGIMGSTEWVEQFEDDLSQKAVAYLNADMAATGLAFGGGASPSLKGVIAGAAKSMADVRGSGTVYDNWLARTVGAGKPMFGNLGGGSDHLPFYVHAGIPSAALAMSSGVPVYHSVYDSMAWYERFADPSFQAGPAMAKLNGIVALRLANADVLPYSVRAYADDFAAHLNGLVQRAKSLDVSFAVGELQEGCDALKRATVRFAHLRNEQLGKLDADMRGVLNQKLMGLERHWLHSEGLQERPWSRSLFGAEDPNEGYAPWMLPGLRCEIEKKNADGLAKWTAVYVDALTRLETDVSAMCQLWPGNG